MKGQYMRSFEASSSSASCDPPSPSRHPPASAGPRSATVSHAIHTLAHRHAVPFGGHACRSNGHADGHAGRRGGAGVTFASFFLLPRAFMPFFSALGVTGTSLALEALRAWKQFWHIRTCSGGEGQRDARFRAREQ
eukprot:2942145-Rhodomonas_salina.1